MYYKRGVLFELKKYPQLGESHFVESSENPSDKTMILG